MSIANKQSDLGPAELKVARTLPSEDISVGDDVAISEIAYQYPSFLWPDADTTMLPPHQKVRITFQPFEDYLPMKVKSICLPFVLCEMHNDKHQVLDIRQIQLVKLDPAFAKEVRKSLKSDTESTRKTTKKRRKSKRKKKFKK